ncbi:MAG: serine/threonine-protein phosphatase [Lachnospiraceae bacterium]|nr:serine/threonine-protein phosphatase [Lachnospiraceae bacterium]
MKKNNNTYNLSHWRSLLLQVSILFLIGIITAGLVNFISQKKRSDASILQSLESLASKISEEVRLSIREYPASNWLMRYWHDHPREMDIEYDVDFSRNTRTYQKSCELAEKYPGVPLRYVSEDLLKEMPKEDQKLYAEIVYSWMITRLNTIKRTYKVDYLFVIVTNADCSSQFFLLSAAEKGMVRGTEYEQAYPLGTEVDVSESQQQGMQSARRNRTYLAEAGKYMDYYAVIASLDNRPVLIGMTYNTSDIRLAVQDNMSQSMKFTMMHQVGLSLICLAMMWFFVLRPLKAVQKNIRLYKKTKDSGEVVKNLEKIHPRNEIGQLSEDVSSLAVEIDDYLQEIRTITAEKERIGVELSLASRIQESMLPSEFPAFPNRNEFDVYAVMDPAKEVGGDFYDFFLIDEDHLCVCIADVSGKGIPAALFMMASMIILGNNARMGKTPAQILTDTNEMISANNKENMFVTVWLGILEISTGRLTAANAGHEFPVLRQPGGSFEYYKDKHGFVIGGMRGAKYKEYEILLQPGAKLFVYTDGLPEATDAEEGMFGKERVLEALNCGPEGAPEQVLKNVRGAVEEFVKEAEQFDDLTMLCLEYRGKDNV